MSDRTNEQKIAELQRRVHNLEHVLKEALTIISDLEGDTGSYPSEAENLTHAWWEAEDNGYRLD